MEDHIRDLISLNAGRPILILVGAATLLIALSWARLLFKLSKRKPFLIQGLLTIGVSIGVIGGYFAAANRVEIYSGQEAKRMADAFLNQKTILVSQGSEYLLVDITDQSSEPQAFDKGVIDQFSKDSPVFQAMIDGKRTQTRAIFFPPVPRREFSA